MIFGFGCVFSLLFFADYQEFLVVLSMVGVQIYRELRRRIRGERRVLGQRPHTTTADLAGTSCDHN